MTSKKFKCIAVSSPSFSKHKTLVEETKAICETLIINEIGTKFDENQLASWFNETKAEGIIVGTDPLSAKAISLLKHAKAVGKYGVGCDNVDIEALKARGIHFGWEGGVNKRSVSELALTFMMGHFRNIFKSIDKMQNASWDKDGGVQLSNRTVGIVGLGFIGSDLAHLLKNFGCKILYTDIVDKSKEAKNLGIEYADFSELVKSCDVISFHVPGGSATKHMFGTKELTYAKKSLLLINTARGHIVDFNAVTEAVLNKRIAGYASDVFPDEPQEQSRFKIQDGFYFTPHIGGNADEAVLNMGRSAIKGLSNYLNA